MAAQLIQLDMFINEKAELERVQREENEKVIKKSLRALFYRMNELEETVLDQQKVIDRLRETVYKEKTPN